MLRRALFCLCNNFLVTKSKYWYGEHVQTCQECCFFGFFLLYIKKRNLKTIMKDLSSSFAVWFENDELASSKTLEL